MSLMSERIYSRRKELNMTMEELGNKVGVSKSTVNKWEKGQIQNIKRSTIAKLAEVLECDPAWLMGYAGRQLSIHDYPEIFEPKKDYMIVSDKVPDLIIEEQHTNKDNLLNFYEKLLDKLTKDTSYRQFMERAINASPEELEILKKLLDQLQNK